MSRTSAHVTWSDNPAIAFSSIVKRAFPESFDDTFQRKMRELAKQFDRAGIKIDSLVMRMESKPTKKMEKIKE